MNLIISAIIVSAGLIIAGSLFDVDTIIKIGGDKELITQTQCLHEIQAAVRAQNEGEI
jgi:hypothetical protein